MLPVAYLARQLTTGCRRCAARLGARFVAITQVGDSLRCTATVAEKLPGRMVRLVLSVHDQSGIEKLAGEAVVELA